MPIAESHLSCIQESRSSHGLTRPSASAFLNCQPLPKSFVLPSTTYSTMNDGQEAFRKFANQLKTRGSPGGPGGKGLFAGSGLLIALVAGGFAFNQSLFNGAY